MQALRKLAVTNVQEHHYEKLAIVDGSISKSQTPIEKATAPKAEDSPQPATDALETLPPEETSAEVQK